MNEVPWFGWIGFAIVLAGWWISDAIQDFTEAYKEIHDPPLDEEEEIDS